MNNQTIDPILHAVEIGQLLDIYGDLLTERQREFAMLHFCEDLSFGEIGKMAKVSRQAVYDAVRHAITALQDYEAKLGQIERLRIQQIAGENIRRALTQLKEIQTNKNRQNIEGITELLENSKSLLESNLE